MASLSNSSQSTSFSENDSETTSTSIKSNSSQEPNKIRTFLNLLRKSIGVPDLAAVRFSLPAQLLEPTPNLEYSAYLDRPDAFASIGDSDLPLGRMLGVIRFWFTKDLKYVKSKPVKPYNSILGEFFRCHFNVDIPMPKLLNSSPDTSATLSTTQGQSHKVCFLTEQISHHPPVSAYYMECRDKGVIGRGYDHLCAKFTGTSVKISPGSYNTGIFITLTSRNNETYRLTHPIAFIGGLLRGSLSVSVAESCSITCPNTMLKTILHYPTEGWLGKSHNRVEGVIFKYNPDNDIISRIKDIPSRDIFATISGSWTDKIYYRLTKYANPADSTLSLENQLLLDVNTLFPVAKIVPDFADQLPNESRRQWQNVTDSILAQNFTQATRYKHEIEDRQRSAAAKRNELNVTWTPRYFIRSQNDPSSPTDIPQLSNLGCRAVDGLFAGNFKLESPTNED